MLDNEQSHYATQHTELLRENSGIWNST